MTPVQHKPIHQTTEVTPLELFFDLVYAFAISQLSHHLLADLTWRGVAETLVLLLTVVTAWGFTSWVVTHTRVESLSTRGMVMAVTLFGLYMNAAIPEAFTTSSWAFVVPMLVIQLGRTIWCILNIHDVLYRSHYTRLLIWLLAITPLWIIGASVEPESRLIWWGAATGIELIGTWFAHPLLGRHLESEKLEFDGDHMLERCRLFLMIALGETVLTAGSAISHHAISMTTIVTGTAALIGNLALWALLFGTANRRVSAHMHTTHDPVHSSRRAFNSVMVVVAGLVAVAVANEMIISDPQSTTMLALTLLLFGGPILMLTAVGVFTRTILKLSARYLLIGAAGMFILALLSYRLSREEQLLIASSWLVAIAWLDSQHG